MQPDPVFVDQWRQTGGRCDDTRDEVCKAEKNTSSSRNLGLRGHDQIPQGGGDMLLIRQKARARLARLAVNELDHNHLCAVINSTGRLYNIA